ncbi:MAG TPA: hypothetical protein VFG77_01215 [Nitrososphaeraceae archaeon]|jgi:hypothetical protein|nr:hypothetical protein [Nitrososphaeraceae archaeon]
MRPGRYNSIICIDTGNFSQPQLNLAFAPADAEVTEFPPHFIQGGGAQPSSVLVASSLPTLLFS